MPWDKLVWLIGYVIFLAGISVYSRSKADTLNKFVLGGRNVGPPMTRSKPYQPSTPETP